MKLKFICPKCKEEQQLEEVLINVVQTSVISTIDDSGAVDYEPNPVIEAGEIDHYQCAECGFVIEMDDYNARITDPEELVDWIKKHCRQD